MVIAVDGNEANVKERVGVSVYTLEILKEFKKKADKKLQFIIYLKNKPEEHMPKEKTGFRYQVVKPKFLWSQLSLPFNLYLKKQIDLFFAPAHYLPRFCPVSSVVTVHDLSYFYYPQDFLKKDLYQLKNWTKYSVQKAKKVIAVSKTTKKDLVRFYHLPYEKIEVVYNGYEKKLKSKNLKVKTKTKISKLLKQKYILYVGTLQPRKNITTLIEAFGQLAADKPDYFLVIVGKKGWLYERIFEQVKKLKLEKRVYFTGYLPETIVAGLYKKAQMFVLPSFYEGFGIPILEAMSHGCPVIASFASSLPEVGGEACLYFDPNSSADLKVKILELLKNQPLKEELVKKGKNRVKLFSWQKCARETIGIIRKVADEK